MGSLDAVEKLKPWMSSLPTAEVFFVGFFLCRFTQDNGSLPFPIGFGKYINTSLNHLWKNLHFQRYHIYHRFPQLLIRWRLLIPRRQHALFVTTFSS